MCVSGWEHKPGMPQARVTLSELGAGGATFTFPCKSSDVPELDQFVALRLSYGDDQEPDPDLERKGQQEP